MLKKIKSIRVKNFKCFNNSKFYEFIIDDSKNPIILTGPNGFGKTTFFDAVELIFSKKITRFNSTIENGRTDLQKNILLNEAAYDGYIVCTLVDAEREYLTLFAKIDHRMHKVSFEESIVYGVVKGNIATDLLDETIANYSDWKNSISDFDVIKYSKDNFSVYYYVSQDESVHFLKQSINQRKNTLNALLEVDGIDDCNEFITNSLIGKNKASTNNLINDQIRYLEGIVDADVVHLKSLLDKNDTATLMPFFQIFNLVDSNIPVWDSEKLGDVDISDLETGIRDIDRISNFVRDYDDYQKYLWNKRLEKAMLIGIDDYLMVRNYVKNLKVNVDSLRKEIQSKNRILEIYNISGALRGHEVDYNEYSSENIRKLFELFPESALFDVDEVESLCNQLRVKGRSLSIKQDNLRILESARIKLNEAYNNYDGKSDKCPFCGHAYGEYAKLDEAYCSIRSLLETECGEDLKEYKELLVRVNELTHESRMVLHKEIGHIDDKEALRLLDEIKRYTTFVSDNMRISDVEMLIPFITVDSSFENMGIREQISELHRLLTMCQKKYCNEAFSKNLLDYKYDLLREEYKYIDLHNEANFLDEEMIKNKKLYIQSAINQKVNKEVEEIKKNAKDNIRKLIQLNNIRDDLKNLQNVYLDAIESYKNQVLKKLRVPLLIYTGKILQDYQNGLGVFVSKDEMRFVANGEEKIDILNSFSSGQLSGFVLAFLFSMNKQYVKESEDDLNFILIDDPVQTMDDINISSMIEVLRNDFKDRQIILSTHETDKENYILYKFFKYNRIGQSLNVKEQLYSI